LIGQLRLKKEVKMPRVKTREAILSKGEAPGKMLVAQIISQGRTSWLLQISAIEGDSARNLVLTRREWKALRKLVEGK
jgi:hypothetical protein